jgi:hypothetical protein
MSFEDAETLAFVLSGVKSEYTNTVVTMLRFKEWLKRWEIHRKSRIRAVLSLTNLSVKLRTPSSYRFLQWLKEWFIFLFFKFKGPGGYLWLYNYDASSLKVIQALL